VILAIGMGLTMAPSTASIMSALPMGKAGVGSAINDTTRELGGALGVAVLGSLLASGYRAHMHDTVAQLPARLADAVNASLGKALGAAASLPGRQGAALARTAKDGFVHGMSIALLVGAGMAALGCVLVYRYLPRTVEVHAPAPEGAVAGEPEPEMAAG
jgi:hypothetical protein